MPNNKKFYQTTITVIVLSESPIPIGMKLADIESEFTDGGYSAAISYEAKELTAPEARDALVSQGSSPDFFSLDEG